jgi:hypothetical protein
MGGAYVGKVLWRWGNEMYVISKQRSIFGKEGDREETMGCMLGMFFGRITNYFVK